MSDPLRTDAARPAGPLADTDKEARIEQLLLSGLDQYFAGEYEQAINIWTRVVFLERGHSRARAYVERARGALAERHRESEELLHRGITAFNNGETDAARDLITRALERGGPHDVALALLERLNRLATPAAMPETPRVALAEHRTQAPRIIVKTGRYSWRMLATVVLAVAALAVTIAALGGRPMRSWVADPGGSPQGQVAALPPDPLPIATSSERLVARARAFQSGGHLLDAIRTLESIDLADPLRPEADKLRGELQLQLLEAVPAEAPR